MSEAPASIPEIRQELRRVDAGIFALLDERIKLRMALKEAQWEQESAKERVAQAPSVDIEALEQEMSEADEKMLELWGKVIELSARHFEA